MAVVRALDLDVELASRPGVRPADALLDVDRLVEVAEEFVASGEDPGLVAFLAYLDTAEERERGLEVEVAEPDGERVQLMTVHAAKGLEWDAVFVAGLTKDVFPVGGRPVADWGEQVYTLPFPLRGDRDELPVLDWQGATDQVARARKLAQFTEACRARGALEERRLAYVAVTRARSAAGLLGLVVGQHRQEAARAVEPARRAARPVPRRWRDGRRLEPDPEDGAPNPMAAEPPSGAWPYDPLGGRRPHVEAAAALVRGAGALTGRGDPRRPVPGREVTGARVQAWDRELELLLAELARARARGGGPVVELPARLSVSQLVALRRDPVAAGQVAAPPAPAPPRAAGPSGHPRSTSGSSSGGAAAAPRRRRAARCR